MHVSDDDYDTNEGHPVNFISMLLAAIQMRILYLLQ